MSEQRKPWAEPEAQVEEPEAPLFRVTRGEVTEEELAALTAVLAAASAAEPEPEPHARTRNEVLRRATRLRQRLLSVPGAWRMRGR